MSLAGVWVCGVKEHAHTPAANPVHQMHTQFPIVCSWRFPGRSHQMVPTTPNQHGCVAAVISGNLDRTELQARGLTLG